METIKENIKGFYLYTPKKDYFFVTNQIRITDKLISRIQWIISSGWYYGSYLYLKSSLKKASYTQKKSEKWGIAHCIDGENFSCGDFEKNRPCEIHYL